ncbi:pseudouridine synthase [Desulfovibrio sp.]|uniref:pseudouridine synthase n=1 Tax=Desulfovibrio sp. TaxID=885 RepID=UPI0025C438BD|nr:pseudouridine synthase [Desulfovibrio sp.]
MKPAHKTLCANRQDGKGQDDTSPDTAAGGPVAAPAQEFCVDHQHAGLRLDQALEYLLPHMGLRGRRRCIENGGVSVNGRAASASRRMRQGDVVRLHGMEARNAPAALGSELSCTAFSSGSAAAASGLRMLGRQGEYCFFSKPARMHSAALAGACGMSVEALAPALAALWAEKSSSGNDFDPARLALLQRLDFGTSGLLCAALSAAAAEAFRAAEAAGLCEKRYVALLSGVLSGPAVARQQLDVSGRRKSRVLPALAHHTRWTEFWPLHVWKPGDASVQALHALFGPAQGVEPEADGSVVKAEAGGLPVPAGGLTLAACRIRRGARHQIRAHAAGMGHALWGDNLYAEPEEPVAAGDGPAVDLASALACGNTAKGNMPIPPVFSPLCDAAGFFLHHGGLRLPGAAVTDDPPWPLPEGCMKAARDWLAGVLLGEEPSRAW